MEEFTVSFQSSGQFFDEEVNPAPLNFISKTLEQAFNFHFGDIYKSKGRIFSRTPFNLTKSFDYLKNLIVRKRREKDRRKESENGK